MEEIEREREKGEKYILTGSVKNDDVMVTKRERETVIMVLTVVVIVVAVTAMCHSPSKRFTSTSAECDSISYL